MTAAPAPRVPGDAACHGAHPVLVIDADPQLTHMLGEWLAACGCTPHQASAPGVPAPGRYALVIVDVPFARRDGSELLRRIAREHPGTPILALSPTFFGSVACAGALAQALGVASVLPKPLSRDALIAAVHRVLG